MSEKRTRAGGGWLTMWNFVFI